MNDQNTPAQRSAASYPQPFPSWPPPSGGYPVTAWEVGPIAGTPPPGTTFPAGHFIDGLGTVVTPTRVYSGLGN